MALVLYAAGKEHARWPLSDVFSTAAHYLQTHSDPREAEAAFLRDIARRVRRRA